MMNLSQNKWYVYDIESDGLLDSATKIHCLSIAWRDPYTGSIRVKSTADYDEMRKFFKRTDIIRVGHNITLYDERVVSKLLGINTLDTKDQIIDTLALSWYLFPERKRHGLEGWGEDLGIKKVEIKDWKNLSTQEYIHRCEEDVKINLRLFEHCLSDLLKIYNNVEADYMRLIEYLQFKLDCVREQEETKIKLDILHVEDTLKKLRTEKEKKEVILKLSMPKVPVKVTKTYKNVIVNPETGEFYEKGDLLYDFYYRSGYRPKATHEVNIIKSFKDPNPNSPDQRKLWLYGLGWKPQNFKQTKSKKTGEVKKVPQIASRANDGSICDSVKALFNKEPALEVLEGLSVLSHRIGILEGFLENQKDGYLEASLGGLTNTLRLKHVNIVNLPGISKAYGKEIRGSLIAEDEGILCGSDMSSLEDSTKQHYMYFYDPKYVTEMRTPGFDPHLDIAELSGLLTKQQVLDHKSGVANYKNIRHTAKTVNFASVYGAGPPKIAETANISLKEARKLHKTYWDRNKAVKQVAEACVVKEINGKKWLFNPVSKFWYSLRAEKDRFSTLNQSTGVYCFDQYIKQARMRGIKISLQMHDEILFKTVEKNKEYIQYQLRECIDSVNAIIKLNIPLGISIDFGKNYADCH